MKRLHVLAILSLLGAIFYIVDISALATEVVQVGKSPVREESAVVTNGEYIAPNEFESHVYQNLVADKKSTLIAIGTFRGLDRSAMGKFSNTILLDYDDLTTRFNAANIKAIAQAHDRQEYLKLLRGYFGKFTQNSQLAEAIRMANATSKRAASTILGSDKVFKKIKEKIVRGQIIALRGDLAGTITLKDLGKALINMGEKVSVLDLSNALDHIFVYGPKAGAGFLDNLERLPWAEDALILFSSYSPGTINDPHVRVSEQDHWIYFAISKKDLAHAGRLGHLDSLNNFNQFKSTIWHLRKSGTPARLVTPKSNFSCELLLDTQSDRKEAKK